jgi:hypothetical protein
MRKGWSSVLLTLFIMASSVPAWAQYRVLSGTFGSGGGTQAGTGFIVYSTAGQPVIGIAAGGSNTVEAGFWYAAGISSTLDVTITSFFAELKDDAVLLSWSVSASSSFDGFNVYRSISSENGFARLNEELVPKEHGNNFRDETPLPGQSYFYRVGAVGEEGEAFSQTITIAVPPKPTTLYQNYPNPFNPSTSIVFYLPKEQPVMLAIYDVNGSRVRTLVEGTKPAGRHTVLWNGQGDRGNQVGSGVYYYRLKAGKTTITKKLVIIR